MKVQVSYVGIVVNSVAVVFVVLFDGFNDIR